MRLDKSKIVSLTEWVVMPVAILLTVWYITTQVLRYTLLMQEQKGLFLRTTDYLRQTFSDSWPVTTLLSDFLIQFYQNAVHAGLITALIVTAIYFCACFIFRFARIKGLAGLLAACVSWYLIAHAPTPHRGVVILVIAIAISLISVLIPYKKPKEAGKNAWMTLSAVTAVMLFATTYIIATDKEIKSNEKFAAVEYASRCHDWNLVLKIATISACKADMSYVPYAMLALSASGQLGERFMDYPVTGPESLGENGESSWSEYSLRSLIYEVTGCPNEAIHQTYQMAASLPHATSFGVLRQMMRLQMENGDYKLARKYAEVLARSPRNRKVAKAALEMADEMESSSEPSSAIEPREDAVISYNNPMYNMGVIISNCHNATGAAGDRMLVHLLLSGDRQGFRSALEELYDTSKPEQLPKYYKLNYQK